MVLPTFSPDGSRSAETEQELFEASPNGNPTGLAVTFQLRGANDPSALLFQAMTKDFDMATFTARRLLRRFPRQHDPNWFSAHCAISNTKNDRGHILAERDSADDRRLLAAWPVPRQPGWLEHVNTPQTEAELSAVRRSVNRGNPFGSESWTTQAIRRLGLESTLRPRGRPKKAQNGS